MSSEKPLFSILTCSYNQKQFQGVWLKSVLRQDYRPLEVVFVDDCSDTNDAKALEKHRKLFEDAGINLTIHRNQDSLYCASSYLEALRLAKGDYFGVVDADDALTEGSVSAVMKCYLKHPDVGFIYTQFDWCNSEMGNCRRGFCRQPARGRNLLTGEKSPQSRHCYSHWRTFRRLPDIESIFKPRLRCSVDKYMGYRLEELAPGVFLNRVCYKYRNGVSSGVTQNEKSIETWKSVRREVMRRRKANQTKVYPIRTIQTKR